MYDNEITQCLLEIEREERRRAFAAANRRWERTGEPAPEANRRAAGLRLERFWQNLTRRRSAAVPPGLGAIPRGSSGNSN
jgi:hypothetical protein